MRREGELTITLKSDLCAGSGYSYAGLIDEDICFDKYGIPYIPARRLKGCLRQSAEDYLEGTLVSKEDIDKIFGVTGDNDSRGIQLDNAYPRQYEELYKELETACNSVELHRENILKQFTKVLAQTELEDGVAKSNSLHFTRVLSRYSPIDGSEMTFTARFYIDSSDEAIMHKIENIARATRNIGVKRNRGLGSVKCSITYSDKVFENISEGNGDTEKVISYTIQNTAPLMLGNLSDTESIKYIPGQTMLGFVAGAYLKRACETSQEASKDPVFSELFLDGSTKYSNLYLSEAGRTFYPAPTYINRLKSTGKYVNVLNRSYTQAESFADGYDFHGGNQPKKLTGKYVFMNDDLVLSVKEAETSMVYHHSNKGKSRNGEEGILYCMETVDAMQEFSGKIYTKEKYVPVITDILKNGGIKLGKSRSAQYGTCRLIDLSVDDVSDGKSVEGTIVVTFCSDAIFLNERGEYTVYEDEIYELVAKRLGIDAVIDRTAVKEYPPMLSTKTVVGYQSTWNLHKMPIPAICAGSCIVYPLKGKAAIDSLMVGERNLEGFGFVRLDDYAKMHYEAAVLPKEDPIGEKTQDGVSIQVVRKLLQDILIDSVMDDMKLNANQTRMNCGVSSLGRVTLMLKESLSLNKDPDGAKQDFANRIKSIKTQSVKEEGRKIYAAVTGLKIKLNDRQKKLASLIGLSDEEVEELLNEHWGEFAMTVLTLEKYRKAAEKEGR